MPTSKLGGWLRSRTSTTRLPDPRPGRLAALLLLLLLLALELRTSRTLSAAWDEVAHLGAGYGYAVAGDYRLNPEHPPLAKLMAGMALARLPVEDVLETEGWRRADQWKFGSRLILHPAMPRWSLLERARVPMMLLSLLGGAVVFRLGLALHGMASGLVALLLYLGCPMVLGHGILVTTDAPMMTFGAAAVWLGLELRRGAGTVVLLALAAVMALALVVKFNAVLLLPMMGLLLLLPPAPGAVRRLLILAFATVVFFVLAGLAVYQGGRFFELYPRGFRLALSRELAVADYPFYLLGQFSSRGFWSYFVVTYVLKTPLPALLLLVLGVIDVVRRPPGRDELAAVVLPGLWWLGVTTVLAANIGLRYLLPAFPFAMLLGARVASAAGPMRAIAVTLAVASVAAAVRAPDPIGYTNIFVPRARAIESMDDSNLDWGQGLRALELRLAEVQTRDVVNVIYFGGLSAAEAIGPAVRDMSMAEALARRPLPPGTYAVSSQLLLREPELRHKLERGCGVEAWLGPSLNLYCCPRCVAPSADDAILGAR